MSRPQQQPKPDDKLPAEEPAAATNGVETTTTSSLAPTTYIDPKADAVVVSDDGREFHVQSYMLKANSSKLRELLGSSSEPIRIDADRKTLKLFLDMIHMTPLPGSYVWSMRDRLFPLIDNLEAESVADRALTLCLECPERDPWGMFVAASQRNHVPLARGALWALARDESMNQGSFADDNEDIFGPHSFGNGHSHSHHGSPVSHHRSLGGSGYSSMLSSPSSTSSKRSSKAVPPPSLRSLTANNVEGVSAPFMLGLLNAVVAAAEDRAPLGWTAIANRFEPVFPEEASAVLSKKQRKRLVAQFEQGHPGQFGQFEGRQVNSVSPRLGGGGGLGLSFGNQGALPQQMKGKQMGGHSGGMKGHPVGMSQPRGQQVLAA